METASPRIAAILPLFAIALAITAAAAYGWTRYGGDIYLDSLIAFAATCI
jgi:hypothetical protein